MCLENKRTRCDRVYQGWKPPGASRAMSRGDVHTDDGVLDIQVRHPFSRFTVSTCVNLGTVLSRLLSFTRHEDRPDFKKVEESMQSYYSSLSKKTE